MTNQLTGHRFPPPSVPSPTTRACSAQTSSCPAPLATGNPALDVSTLPLIDLPVQLHPRQPNPFLPDLPVQLNPARPLSIPSHARLVIHTLLGPFRPPTDFVIPALPKADRFDSLPTSQLSPPLVSTSQDNPDDPTRPAFSTPRPDEPARAETSRNSPNRRADPPPPSRVPAQPASTSRPTTPQRLPNPRAPRVLLGPDKPPLLPR